MRLTCFLSLLIFVSCAQQADSEVEDRSGRFVHTVYLNIHDTLPKSDIAMLIVEMEKLTEIPGVLNLVAGRFEDVNDDRALKQYELVMQMEFENMSDYKIYQEHPIHLNLREVAGGYLSERPAVHDFIIH